jgi:hypothetical protein
MIGLFIWTITDAINAVAILFCVFCVLVFAITGGFKK